MDSDTLDDDPMLTFTVALRLTKTELAGLVRQANLHSGLDCAPRAISIGNSVERAKWLYQFEMQRRKLPGIETSLGDPTWMILLDLYVRDAEGYSTSISSATIASAAPPTTGLRHVTVLESKGYIRRKGHPDDDRVFLLNLTDFGRQAVARVLRRAV